MHQTLCDVCEQPIAEPYGRDAVRLETPISYDYRRRAVYLHLHLKCWDGVRVQFLSERTRDDNDALREAEQVRERARSWFERVLAWLLP